MNDEQERANKDAIDPGLSHKDVVDQLTRVSADVMMVLLSNSLARKTYVLESLKEELRADVIGVLRNRKLSPPQIDHEVDWSDTMTEATRRTRMVLIALILSIYN